MSKGTIKTKVINIAPLPLSEKERSVLSFIEQSFLNDGISPSYQEIKDHFGFASFNSVQNYLKQLSNKGYVSIASNQKRAIQLLKPSNSAQESAQKMIANKAGSEVLSLSLMGKVAAGRPLESLSHDEFIDVPSSFVKSANNTFALKVSGDSMIEDGIHDGDVILVQKQPTAINGQVVVASIENESTVKRYFLRPHPEQKARMVELRPANSTLNSMWYPPSDVNIQGILVGLIRRF